MDLPIVEEEVRFASFLYRSVLRPLIIDRFHDRGQGCSRKTLPKQLYLENSSLIITAMFKTLFPEYLMSS